MNQILSRQDIVHNQVETFGYDGLNRLTSIGSRQIAYASNGNVTAIDGAGTMAYTNPAKPYTLTSFNPGPGVQVHDYGASYSAFDRPVTLSEDSITHITDADGDLVAEYSYDPWGRLRDPGTLVISGSSSSPALLLGRGFTGHEHLPWFGLINMNARLYDPLLGRFLAPDPFVQDPDFTQNFNRYS
jgi:RHS repeat-associated protein